MKEKCFLLGGFEGVLPATPPKKGVDGGELFQCFRPEFLEGYGGGVMSGCAFRVDGEYAENLVWIFFCVPLFSVSLFFICKSYILPLLS